MGDVIRRLAAGVLAGLTIIAVRSPAALSGSPSVQGSLRVSGEGAAPVDISAFVADIERLEHAVSRASPAALPALRATLPRQWVVRMAGEEVDVPARWLAALIEEGQRDPAHWPAIRARLLTRLSAVRAEAASAAGVSASPPPSASAPRGRTVLHDVLARREFTAARQTSWVTSLRERFEQWLLDLWRRLGGERLGQRRTAMVLAWLAVLAGLSVLVSWIVRALLRATRDEALHLTVPESRRKSARAWARDALKAIDPADAARCAYHAALTRLEEEGTWRTDETRTPREYLRLLPAAHARRPILADLTHRFEQIWYGARAATADDVRSVVAHLKELGCLPAD
jgi:hypothetical protein